MPFDDVFIVETDHTVHIMIKCILALFQLARRCCKVKITLNWFTAFLFWICLAHCAIYKHALNKAVDRRLRFIWTNQKSYSVCSANSFKLRKVFQQACFELHLLNKIKIALWALTLPAAFRQKRLLCWIDVFFYAVSFFVDIARVSHVLIQQQEVMSATTLSLGHIKIHTVLSHFHSACASHSETCVPML